MDTSETANETTSPTASKIISLLLAVKPLYRNLAIFNKDAPIITGIAIKKENSALATLDTPKSIPPRMVEPERDVPGINESI